MLKKTLLALILAACGDSNEPKKVDKENENVSEKENTNNEDSVEDTVFAVGDTVEFNGIEMTLTDAEFTEPEEYSEPDNGKVITIEVEVNNLENEQELLVDDLDFNIADEEGFVMDKYFGYDESEIHGFIPAGKKIKGKLFYDVNDSGKYEFTYTPSLHTEEVTLTFDIEL